MLAQERAKELIEKFGDKAADVVDEILSEILAFDSLLKAFYLNVKEEIKKLQ